MEFSWEKLYNLLKKEKELMLLTIIDKKGSTPRGVGTSMIVLKNGDIFGTIGGGPVENELINESLDFFKNKQSVIKEKFFTGDSVICGGKIKVLIEYFSENDLFFLESLIKEYNERDIYLIRDLLTFERKISEKPLSDDKFYVQKIEAKPLLYIFGGGHIAVPLVKIAKLCEFKISVFDDRKEFATKERFPEADEVILVDFEQVLPYINFTNNTYMVLITREHAHDEIILRQILGKTYKYIGMIGSKKRVASVKERLIKSGFNEKEVNSLYSPIGLDINSETPAEIAVSIIAEIIKVKND